MEDIDDPVPQYTKTADTTTKEITNDSITTTPESPTQTKQDTPEQDVAEAQPPQHTDFYTRIYAAKSLTLPVLAAPPYVASATPEEADNRILTLDIIATFFASITRGRDDIVRDFVARGLVSPDVTTLQGETPLLAAVRERSLPMINTLLSLGALVDQYGETPITIPRNRKKRSGPDERYVTRTPLQLASQTGYLAAVKLLMEDHSADDALIAPDGALALRLAAEGRHREIVEYLPQRRGGAGLRWKAAHKREMEVVRKALRGIGRFVLYFVWRVPKFLLYTFPVEASRDVWRQRARIGKWVAKLPSKVGHATKRVAKRVFKEVKNFPQNVKSLIDLLGDVLKRIPKAVAIVYRYISTNVVKVGRAIGTLTLAILGLFHTMVTSVITWFKTHGLKDIKDGFLYVLDALFVVLPLAVFSFVAEFGKMSYKALKTVFGFLGKAIWWVCLGIVEVAVYLPKKTLDIILAMGRLFQRGTNECLVFFDPKRI